MKIIECEQGSPEWIEARLGMPTASRFDMILTPAKLDLSKSAEVLINMLIAEMILGQFEDSEETDWMNRGSNLEEIAADEYAFKNDVDLKKIGFVTTDDGLIGCSPDRIITGQNAGLEIKNPKAHIHIGYLRNPGSLSNKYRCQVQTTIWIMEADYWDLMSYHPYLPRVIERCLPDEKFQSAAQQVMYSDTGFLYRLEKAKQEISLIVEDANVKKRLRDKVSA